MLNCFLSKCLTGILIVYSRILIVYAGILIVYTGIVTVYTGILIVYIGVLMPPLEAVNVWGLTINAKGQGTMRVYS